MKSVQSSTPRTEGPSARKARIRVNFRAQLA